MANQYVLQTEFQLSNGAVRLKQSIVAYCKGYADMPKVQETFDLFSEDIRLYITYESSPTVSPSDLKNF